jgi:hypothetical protein
MLKKYLPIILFVIPLMGCDNMMHHRSYRNSTQEAQAAAAEAKKASEEAADAATRAEQAAKRAERMSRQPQKK